MNGIGSKMTKEIDIMKKTLPIALALLICGTAAGCRNHDVPVQTLVETQISSINGEALEKAVSEHLSERAAENQSSETVTAASADDTEAAEHIDTAPIESDIPGYSEIITLPETAETSDVQNEAVKAEYSVSEVSGNFNTAFLKEAAKNNDNFVISPLSVKLALNMAAAGAGENSGTERELLTLFGYGSSENMVSDSSALISELDRKDGSITVNNSVWISDKKDISISREYTKRLADIFKAEQFQKDLSNKKIVKEFNKWVKKNTGGLIPEMISEPFDESSRMVLVNTLYFKNEWVNKFPEANSHEFIFRGINGETRTMAMTVENNFEYAEGSIFKSVVLPYEDGSKMKAYLPIDEYASLAEIIESLSPAELAKELDLDNTMEKTIVCIPRFECEYKDSLKDTLKLLGISAAFDSSAADFSGMLDGDSVYPLYISDVVQAAKIKCGEKGTEAAAATMAVMDAGAAMPMEEEPPKEFIADRPFLYTIESPSGEVLFMGIISKF